MLEALNFYNNYIAMLSKISKSIQKASTTNQVTTVLILIFRYRLRSSLLPGASAATTRMLIILSKLKLSNLHRKCASLKRHSLFEHAPNFHCRVANSEEFMQFSKEPTSKNFGDLPLGDVPHPLTFNRPYRKFNEPFFPCFGGRRKWLALAGIKVFIIIY